MAGLWGQLSARPQRCCGAKCSLNVILLQPQAWLRVPALSPALSPRGTTVVVPCAHPLSSCSFGSELGRGSSVMLNELFWVVQLGGGIWEATGQRETRRVWARCFHPPAWGRGTFM